MSRPSDPDLPGFADGVVRKCGCSNTVIRVRPIADVCVRVIHVLDGQRLAVGTLFPATAARPGCGERQNQQAGNHEQDARDRPDLTCKMS